MPAPNSSALHRAVRQTGNEAWYFQAGLFRDDDIWLASYPRSGSHFTRFILVSARHYLEQGRFPTDLSGMKTVPDVHGGRLEFAAGPPRIIKTHFPRDPRYRRIIHLIRDPRDVIVSYFHYSQGLPHLFLEPLPERYGLDRFADMFLRGVVWPGDIREHSASYSALPDGVAYTVIRYEALLNEPRREYRRLLDAVGLDFPEAALDALIAHTAFANMLRLHHPESARAGMVETNPVYILRCGQAGRHAETLSTAAAARIAGALGGYLESYGYR